jgi:putative transposase
MPRKRAVEGESKFTFTDEFLEQFAGSGIRTATEVEAVSLRFKKALIDRMLRAELDHHLEAPSGEPPADGRPNHRNGTSAKTVLTGEGAVAIAVPRDRRGTFEPQLIPKHVRRFTGFDDRILSLYARGLTLSEIQGFLLEMYGVEVSRDLISAVTDAVHTEITEWQTRALESMYPVVFFDALRVRIRDGGVVRTKAVYLALAVRRDGTRDILGLWIEQNEGAKFWLQVFNELRTRGCADILIAITDGLKGLTEAIATAFPLTTHQTCIVHLIRNSLDLVGWKERKAVAAALRDIYTAVSAEAAAAALDAFATGPWGRRFPTVVRSWRAAWPQVIPFFAFPPEIRRVIYTTNALESVNAGVRKIIKTRGQFPNDEAATKLIWLALRNIARRWTDKAGHHWRAAMQQFAILYDDRFLQGAT